MIGLYLYIVIYKRTISVFLNWCVRRATKAPSTSWLMDIMKEKLGEAYEMFLSLLVNNEIVEAYKMFLNQLPAIYMSNQHTRPQSLIILDNNIENIDQLINLENHDEMASFYKLMNTEMIIYNISPIQDKLLLMNFLNKNESYRKIIDNTYNADISFFRKYDININRLT